jgi:hypothetical protein
LKRRLKIGKELRTFLSLLNWYGKQSELLSWGVKFLAKANLRGWGKLQVGIEDLSEESQGFDEMNFKGIQSLLLRSAMKLQTKRKSLVFADQAALVE